MSKTLKLIREGEVMSLNETLMSARVVFKDRSELSSAELPILGRGSSSVAGDYWLPSIGDRAVCLMAPNDEQTGGGWILGTRFSKMDPPIKQGGRRLVFENGTAVEFDGADINITVAGNMNINVVGDVSISAGGTAYVKGSQIRLNE